MLAAGSALPSASGATALAEASSPATPDTLHAILAYPPAGSLQQRRDPAIPITAILASKLDDRLRECIFIFSPDRPLALRATRLVRQPTRPALRHPMLLLCMVCCDPSSLRA
jgi:hypothetical protein